MLLSSILLKNKRSLVSPQYVEITRGFNTDHIVTPPVPEMVCPLSMWN